MVTKALVGKLNPKADSGEIDEYEEARTLALGLMYRAVKRLDEKAHAMKHACTLAES